MYGLLQAAKTQVELVEGQPDRANEHVVVVGHIRDLLPGLDDHEVVAHVLHERRIEQEGQVERPAEVGTAAARRGLEFDLVAAPEEATYEIDGRDVGRPSQRESAALVYRQIHLNGHVEGHVGR